MLDEQHTQLTICPEPFSVRRYEEAIVAGLTIAQIVMQFMPERDYQLAAHVWVEGTYVPTEYWRSVRVKPNTRVLIRIIPQHGGGGKSPVAMILSLALLVAAPYAAAALTGMAVSGGLIGTSLLASQAFYVGARIVIGIAGMLLINAIAPPSRQPHTASAGASISEKPTLYITGARNQLLPGGTIPRPVGTFRMAPPYGARPFTEVAGQDQYVRMLFIWGYGPLEISDLKIGETLLSEFTDVEIETKQGYDTDTPLTLWTQTVLQTDLQVSLTFAAGYQTRTTSGAVDEISVDITFPRGLCEFGTSGGKTARTVNIAVEYSPTGAGTWTTTSIPVTASQSSALSQSKRISVTNGIYDVRLKRTTADSSSDQIFDQVVWGALRSFRNESPVNMTGLAMTVLRIKATDQLNGAVDQFNGIVTSILPDWNGSAWVEAATANPASIFKEVAQGLANKAALADSRINLDKLAEWHGDCVTAGRTYNTVIDSVMSVGQVLSNVAAAGRASLGQVDGIWTVVQDKPQTVPIQHFTPRNSFDFQGQKVFADLPHALKVQFFNEDLGYAQDERIVYDDGYDINNATKFESITLDGVTNANQVYKDGRYHIATARLRPETYAFSADIEHLVCTRGDLIRVGHDVMLVGLCYARIKSLTLTDSVLLDDDGSPLLDDDGNELLDDSSSTITSLVLDDQVEMNTGTDYAVRIRLNTGETLYATVVTVDGFTHTLELTTPSTAGITVGDLLMFGEAGVESAEYIVQSIEPRADFVANIICVDAAPAVHTADTGLIPAFTSFITSPYDLARPPTPILSAIQTGDEVLIRNPDGTIINTAVITLTPPYFHRVLTPLLTARVSGEDDYVPYPTTVSGNQLTVMGLTTSEYYDFRVVYRSVNGISAPLNLSNVQVIGSSGVPSDVENFASNILGDTAFLSWDAVSDLDVSYYQIKFNSSITGATWPNSTVAVDRVPSPATSVAVASQRGTWLIKAFDFAGNESENETLIVSDISVLGLNAVETVTEDPTFLGVKDNASLVGSNLELTNITLGTGTYSFNGSVDLGLIFDCIITANLVAVGHDTNNEVDDWLNVDEVVDWDQAAAVSSWGVVTQLRSTSDDPWADSSNLFAFPSDFSDASWTKTRCSVSTNTTTAPDGTSTADTLTEDNTVTNTHRATESESFTSGLTYTLSVYAKIKNRSFIVLELPASAFPGTPNCFFNLTNGAMGTPSGCTAVAELLGNGWVRCSITATSDASTTGLSAIGLATNITTQSYSGDNTSGIYLWQAQCVQAAAAYSADWSDWASFSITNRTARAYQFQTLLSSFSSGISPSISELSVTVDMKDSVAGDNDQIAASGDVGGTTFNYPFSFKVKPSLAIVAQSLSTGDYWQIDNQDETGFRIKFFNAAASRVTRTFDYIASGYGQGV